MLSKTSHNARGWRADLVRYYSWLIGMRKLLGFTFEREAKWLCVLYVLIPLLAFLLLSVIGLLKRWA